MDDFLKKGFYLGLGAAVSGKEKLEEKLTELVGRNEISREQARAVMDDFVEKGETKTQEWEERQQSKTKEMASEWGMATQDEVSTLKKRIAELEEQLKEQ